MSTLEHIAMRMNKLPLLAAVLALVLLSTSCAEKEDLDPNLTYNLLVENALTRPVDVYIKIQEEVAEPFLLTSSVASFESVILDGLVIREAYLIRFVDQGRPAQEFFEERAFANLDSEIPQIRLLILE